MTWRGTATVVTPVMLGLGLAVVTKGIICSPYNFDKIKLPNFQVFNTISAVVMLFYFNASFCSVFNVSNQSSLYLELIKILLSRT